MFTLPQYFEAPLNAGRFGWSLERRCRPRLDRDGAVGALAREARSLDAVRDSTNDGRDHEPVLSQQSTFSVDDIRTGFA